MCSNCEAIHDMNINYEQYNKRVHVFWEVRIGKFIEYLQLSRPFADKIYVISHNTCGYDAQILLRTFLELRWIPELKMDGSKIPSNACWESECSQVAQFLWMSLRSMPKSLDLTCKKGHYPFLQHGQEFGLCRPLSRIQVLWRRLYVMWRRSQISGVIRGTKRQNLS